MVENGVEIVKKSNALARASWAVKSVYEPRLVAMVASRVHADDKDFETYEISVKELLGEADDGGRSYSLVASVVDNLLGKPITIKESDGSFVKYPIFSKCRYDNKKGSITVRFDPDLKEHFLGLKSHFTKYALVEFLTLPSIYSQRLFEILKSWDDKPEITIALDDLFKALSVPDSLRRYPDFRRYVLEKAHKDIKEKTSFRYGWEPIKKGRSYVAIRFTLSTHRKASQKRATADKTNTENNKLFLAAVACHKLGECKPSARSKKCTICRRVNG